MRRETDIDAPRSSLASGPEPARPGLTMMLYAYEQPARELAPEDVAALSLDENQLLWIDAAGVEAGTVRRTLDALGFAPAQQDFVTARGRDPEFRDFGDGFAVRTEAAALDADLRFRGSPLRIAGRSNVVVSLTDAPLDAVERLRENQRENSALGVLGSESFTVALLDGLLGTYYDAMSTLEHDVEQLEIRILSARSGDCLDQLRTLRKASSQLRRALWAHRAVFGGLARPDFRPDQSRKVDEHFAALDARYERAMDRIEHGRDLVVGTFDLFTTRTAMQTNRNMQVLTFVTVLIGGLAVIAGVLGMNFEAPFFNAAGTGFWIAVGAMIAFAGVFTWFARRRGWV
jgi:magnesium transporter